MLLEKAGYTVFPPMDSSANGRCHSLDRPIAVDLFAGAGGMALGFEQAGFEVKVAVEIDPIHCATHQFNFPQTAVLCRNIEQVSATEIREAGKIGDRDLDVVFGGSPCQGFSIIGKRVLDDPRNALLTHFYRLVQELNPKYFVMENVRGLTNGDRQHLLHALIEQFKAIGYQVNEPYKILNAAHYGVPQNRERLFLIGCRQEFELPAYPQPLTQIATPTPRKRKSKLAHLPFSPNVWDAIGDLPIVEQYPQLWEQDACIAEYGKPSAYAKVLRNLSRCPDDYSYKRHYDLNLLTSSILTQHSEATIERFKQADLGKREKISRFHKLHPHGVSITLRAGTDRDRGSFTSARPIHPKSPRCITVREAARLHSYPDWFRFHVTKWHGFRQVGNSVPPLLAKAVAAEIIRVLKIKVAKPTVKLQLGDESLLQFTLAQAAKYSKVLSRKC